jgi:hypothetical protein
MERVRVRGVVIWTAIAVGTLAAAGQPASAQTVPPPRAVEGGPSAALPAGRFDENDPSAAAAQGEQSGAKSFIGTVVHDYKDFFSKDTAMWLSVGGVGALAIHGADETIRHDTQDPEQAVSLKGGEQYGNDYVQYPLAIGWWIAGAAFGSSRAADAGRDLFRAQISATSWVYVIKYATNRDRPNGDPRSFPSGHAAATFATAVVLQEHYGWKVGLPAFAAAAYTSVSRITDNKHWASDVVFGAALGIASARTVTIHVRQNRVAVAPWVVHGGAGVLASVVNQ